MSYPTVEQHRERSNKDQISKWRVTVHGRKRVIELQEYKRRLYLVGYLYFGHELVLEFEETVFWIAKKLGQIEAIK